MTTPVDDALLRAAMSRRELLAASGVAAAMGGLAISPRAAAAAIDRPRGIARPKEFRHRAPFDSLRDYLACMEECGLLVRFRDVDQDAWEATAIMYQLQDRFGQYELPVVMFENIRQGGRWLKGPLIAANQSHHHQEALVWGLEPDWSNPRNSYRVGLGYMRKLLAANKGDYPQLPPVTVAREQAPCKEVTLEGDAIDLTGFAFIQGNPGDAGRYINTGSTVTRDPEWQQNFGTYRCQLVGPRRYILNSEPNQTANNMIARAIKRGETSMPIAMFLGQDPVTWMVSGTRVPVSPRKPVDEYAYVGGLRGKPLEIVKCDLSELTVPAHCEVVIEGTLDLTQPLQEGPYHEAYGYLGDRNEGRYAVTVNRVTHRRNPIIQNSFTSIGGGFVKAPLDGYVDLLWRSKYPQIQQLFYHDDSKGLLYVTIKKDRPGLGLEIAKAVSERSLIAKVVIVTDDDLDPMSQSDMLVALGSRWQPSKATQLYEKKPASFFEPSSPDGKFTSKAAIDATRQWPEEGGPAEFAAFNRGLFQAAADPGLMARVQAKWPDKLARKPW